MSVTLRPVTDADLDTLYAHQIDPEANHMAAFTSSAMSARADFVAWWDRIRARPAVTARAIVADGALAGSVLCWPADDGLEVSYWLGRAFWGRGLATAGLRALLAEVDGRPVFARAASDNHGSIRVLQKCGFVEIGREVNHAEARGGSIEETVFRLG